MPAIYLDDTLRIRSKGDGKWAVDWLDSATLTWVETIRIESKTGKVERIGAFVQDVEIEKDAPKLVFAGTETGARRFSLRQDTGKIIIKDETAGVDVVKINATTGDVELLGKFKQDVTIEKDNPKQTFTGTETGGRTGSLREEAGKLYIRDETGAVDRANVDLATGNFELTGEPIIPAGKGIQGRDYSGAAQTVTETTATLKDSCAPTGNKKVLYPLNIVIDSSNPTGSGVTLYVEVKLLHSDGTETTIESYSVAAGATDTKDYATNAIAKALKDGVSVTEVRLYAYCSATPATGAEPTVTLTSVKALQF